MAMQTHAAKGIVSISSHEALGASQVEHTSHQLEQVAGG